MRHTIQFDDKDDEGKALLAYLKTLDFVKIDEEGMPNWQKLELDKALDQHQNNTNNYSDWNTVKKELYAKYNVK
jgi:hypothetical protein